MDVEMEEVTPIQTKLSSDIKGKSKVIYDRTKPSGEDNLPWIEKYRPKTLEELVSHEDVTSTIERFIENNRVPHLLFYGPPGTGKTTTILAFARKLYGQNWKNMVMELNASDDRGIDVVREEIKTYASMGRMFSTGFKLIILDEADSMTSSAQNALRRIIEKYTNNVRFCIICNYISKVIPAVQSRCTKFRFSPIGEDQLKSRLEYIIQSENVRITQDGIEALLKISSGDMRRALNVLQACHAAYDYIDEIMVYKCTGNPEPRDIKYIVETMLNDEFTTAYSNIHKLKTEKGLALQDIVSDVHKYLERFDIPLKSRIYFIDQLSQIQYKLATGGSEKAQLALMVGTCKIALDMADKDA